MLTLIYNMTLYNKIIKEKKEKKTDNDSSFKKPSGYKNINTLSF